MAQKPTSWNLHPIAPCFVDELNPLIYCPRQNHPSMDYFRGTSPLLAPKYVRLDPESPIRNQPRLGVPIYRMRNRLAQADWI